MKPDCFAMLTVVPFLVLTLFLIPFCGLVGSVILVSELILFLVLVRFSWISNSFYSSSVLTVFSVSVLIIVFST